MAYVISAAGSLCELYVASYLFPFATRTYSFVTVPTAILSVVDIASFHEFVYFAVSYYHTIELGYLFHRLCHHLAALYASSVVGESYFVLHTIEVYKTTAAFLTYGDSSKRIYLHHSTLCDYLLLDIYISDTVGGRCEVGHSAYGSVSARGSCLTAALDSLFIAEARFSEMHVHIDEAGK